jgi:hypothetical protein
MPPHWTSRHHGVEHQRPPASRYGFGFCSR